MGNGKPVFSMNQEIHFNLSHWKSAVMAMVCDRETGCDIEDSIEDGNEDLLETVFSFTERSIIRNDNIHIVS